MEEGVIAGGVGEGVLGEMARMGLHTPALNLGIQDAFVTQGGVGQLLHEQGLMPRHRCQRARTLSGIVARGSVKFANNERPHVIRGPLKQVELCTLALPTRSANGIEGVGPFSLQGHTGFTADRRKRLRFLFHHVIIHGKPVAISFLTDSMVTNPLP